ncbi:MAG: hypothetical protein J0M30_01350 [Chitinophagales bacterium]|nr:hypothetical protein [Chitinophagales bacterium]
MKRNINRAKKQIQFRRNNAEKNSSRRINRIYSIILVLILALLLFISYYVLNSVNNELLEIAIIIADTLGIISSVAFGVVSFLDLESTKVLSKQNIVFTGVLAVSFLFFSNKFSQKIELKNVSERRYPLLPLDILVKQNFLLSKNSFDSIAPKFIGKVLGGTNIASFVSRTDQRNVYTFTITQSNVPFKKLYEMLNLPYFISFRKRKFQEIDMSTADVDNIWLNCASGNYLEDTSITATVIFLKDSVILDLHHYFSDVKVHNHNKYKIFSIKELNNWFLHLEYNRMSIVKYGDTEISFITRAFNEKQTRLIIREGRNWTYVKNRQVTKIVENDFLNISD